MRIERRRAALTLRSPTVAQGQPKGVPREPLPSYLRPSTEAVPRRLCPAFEHLAGACGGLLATLLTYGFTYLYVSTLLLRE